MFNINYYTYSEIVNLKYDYIILVCNNEYYNESFEPIYTTPRGTKPYNEDKFLYQIIYNNK